MTKLNDRSNNNVDRTDGGNRFKYLNLNFMMLLTALGGVLYFISTSQPIDEPYNVQSAVQSILELLIHPICIGLMALYVIYTAFMAVIGRISFSLALLLILVVFSSVEWCLVLAASGRGLIGSY